MSVGCACVLVFSVALRFGASGVLPLHTAHIRLLQSEGHVRCTVLGKNGAEMGEGENGRERSANRLCSFPYLCWVCYHFQRPTFFFSFEGEGLTG